MRFNQLFLSAVSKNNLKHILKSLGKEISIQTDCTGLLLTQELHPVPRNHWVSTMQSKTRLQTHNHQRSDLDPSRTYTSFGTPQSHHRSPSNSGNTSSYRITDEERNKVDHTWYNKKIKVHSKSYFTLREISKTLSNLGENLISQTDLKS